MFLRSIVVCLQDCTVSPSRRPQFEQLLPQKPLMVNDKYGLVPLYTVL